jgi:hypothetical protein
VRRIDSVRFRRSTSSLAFTGVAQETRGKTLPFSETLDFDRDSVDGVLDSLEALVQSRIAYVAAARVL